MPEQGTIDDAPQLTIQDAEDLLGVKHTAPPGTIRAAWKQHLKQAHPDAGGTNEDVHRATAARDLLLQAGGHE